MSSLTTRFHPSHVSSLRTRFDGVIKLCALTFALITALTSLAVGQQPGNCAPCAAPSAPCTGPCPKTRWWLAWPRGLHGRNARTDVACGTERSCVPQPPYYGYFPTCWKRFSNDWGCPPCEPLFEGPPINQLPEPETAAEASQPVQTSEGVEPVSFPAANPVVQPAYGSDDSEFSTQIGFQSPLPADAAAVGPPAGYPVAGSSYPPSPYPSAPYPSTSHPSTSYPSTSYPSTSYPSTSYPSTSYPSTSYPSAPYPSTSYPSTSYPLTPYPTAPYPTAPYPTALATMPAPTNPTPMYPLAPSVQPQSTFVAPSDVSAPAQVERAPANEPTGGTSSYDSASDSQQITFLCESMYGVALTPTQQVRRQPVLTRPPLFNGKSAFNDSSTRANRGAVASGSNSISR